MDKGTIIYAVVGLTVTVMMLLGVWQAKRWFNWKFGYGSDVM